MSILLQPTETEFVDIDHQDWGLKWAIQFPEAIESADGTIRAWPMIRPDWERLRPDGWGYTWRTSDEYIRQILANNPLWPDGQPHYTKFVTGTELRAEIRTDGQQEIALSLTLTNVGDQPLWGVRSEGGCFQARSEAFRDGDEVARSYIASGGVMTSLTQFSRTIPIRCQYRTERTRDVDAFERFWGRTNAVIDTPALLGAVSRDGTRAVVLGYEHAVEGLQNADDHHCLHSGPWFGDLQPGQSVTRRGWITFGEDIQQLGRTLARRLGNG